MTRVGTRLFGRAMIAVFVVSFGMATSVYLLLSVLPLYAESLGVGELGVGLTTGVMMGGTVAMELAAPWLMARIGYRASAGLCLIMLGVPSLVLLAMPPLPIVLMAALARGGGLGIGVVLGAVLVAELAPAERRGECLGLYGVVVGVPSTIGLPVGLWLATNLGYVEAFAAAAVVALLALAAITSIPTTPGMPGQDAYCGNDEAGDSSATKHSGAELGSVLAALRIRALVRPALVFAAITFAAGVAVTFLPLAVPTDTVRLATIGLLAQSTTMAGARWAAGRYADRHPQHGPNLLLSAVLAAAIGIAVLVWTDSAIAVIGGMALFGAGFGVAQNMTLSMMFQRAGRAGFGKASALWNIAYDGGMGVGAIGFGVLIEFTGYPWGFALTAALILGAVGLVRRDAAVT